MFASTRTRAPLGAALLLALLSAAATTARAVPITLLVGGDGGTACDFSNIQDALNAAASNTGPDTDTIRIAMNATYSAQALKANTTHLNIVGGYATCASATPTPGARTTISGLGGAADSVFEVLASAGQGDLRMENLLIRDGDETDNGVGGGIDYKAQGTLTLANVIVAQNRAGFGGGINFNPSGGSASGNSLTLETDVVIQNNLARNSGGGIRIEGLARAFILGPRTTLLNNEAQGIADDSGYGGGLQILEPAAAEVASSGFGNFGVISGNRSKFGGGIAVNPREGDQPGGYVLLYSVDPVRPVRIDHNIASSSGGGIYLGALANFDDFSAGIACAYEFRIDNNRAPDGAALVLDSASDAIGITRGASAHTNVVNFSTGACGVTAVPPRPTAVFCAPGTICNSIDANVVADVNGQAADGAVVEALEDTILGINRVALSDNRGSDVIHTLTARALDLSNVLIADNVLTARVIASDARANLLNLTIAGNTFGFLDALSLTNTILLRNSVIWQPGKVALGNPHGTLDGFGVLTNDPASLPITGAFNLDPRFIDPGRGDYRMRAASPAIDTVLEENFGGVLDLDGLNRHQDLPMNNGFGPRDLGAYERQALLPLVLNANFNVDTAHWLNVTSGVSAFDATENAPGSPVGGSMNFNWENTPVAMGRVTSRAQCIHLPLPGTYKLNGAARTLAGNGLNGYAARLNWALRRDGTEACTTGAIDAQGDLGITAGTAWARAAAPASITITPDQFTRNSSITISLVMVATGVTFPASMHGWFDDITLTLDIDPLFSNGFE